MATRKSDSPSAAEGSSSRASGADPLRPEPAPLALGQQAPSDPQADSLRRLVMLVAITTTVALIYFGKPVLLPLALSLLLSFLLSPVCTFLERRHIPRVASVVLVVGAAFGLLALLGLAVYQGADQLVGNIETYERNIEAKIEHLPFRGGGGNVERVSEAIEDVGRSIGSGAATQPAETARTGFQLPGTEPENPLYVSEVNTGSSPLDHAGYLLALAAGPLGLAGLVIIFTLFILLARDDLRDRLIKLTAGRHLNVATQALDDAATRISAYLRAQAIVNGSYGLIVGIGLTAISYFFAGELFPSVVLWAILCAVLRFIPYLGPWLAAAFPLLVSVGYYEGYGVFLATAAFFVMLELISNNVMEPLLYGQSTGMSEIAVILAATFWTFVWGPVGLLVATPITTCLVVLGKHVPALQFFDILLGKESVLDPASRFYQRLLALDAEDAQDVIEDALEEDRLLRDVYDDVVLPAMALAERDRHKGHLDDKRADFIRVALREIVTDLGPKAIERQDPAAGDAPSVPAVGERGVTPARVLILPASDEADATAGIMLGQLLEARGYDVTAVSADALASEKLQQVKRFDADVVVLSAVPPRALAQSRYLLKRLRRQCVGVPVIAALWTLRADAKRASARLEGEVRGPADEAESATGEPRYDPNDPDCLPPVQVVRSLAEAVEGVRQRAEVAALRRSTKPDA